MSRASYCDAAFEKRLAESRLQMNALKAGLNEVVPLNLLQLFSARELEHLVCGSVTVDLELLKRHTTYFGGYSSINDAPIQLMWRALESFSHAERSLFLRYVIRWCAWPEALQVYRASSFWRLAVEPSSQPAWWCWLQLRVGSFSIASPGRRMAAEIQRAGVAGIIAGPAWSCHVLLPTEASALPRLCHVLRPPAVSMLVLGWCWCGAYSCAGHADTPSSTARQLTRTLGRLTVLDG